MRAVLALTVLAVAAALAVPALAQDAPPANGSGVTIAILDTGVDAAHGELAGRVTRQSYAQPGLPVDLPIDLPLPSDPDGQGTAVASLAAGATLGIAPQAQVLDLQVSAKYTGTALVDPATEAAAIEALDALLQDPSRAKVVVLSFAQAGLSPSGASTIVAQADRLWDAGVLIVVPTAPSANALAASPHALTVAGTEGCAAPLGPTLKPDLVADSEGRTVATPAALLGTGGTGTRSGTALAAAQVAGAAALLFQVEPDLPVDAAAAFLRDTAHDQGTPGPDDCSGYGELDATEAVAWARMWRDPLAQESRATPGVALPLLVGALALAAWVNRRHG